MKQVITMLIHHRNIQTLVWPQFYRVCIVQSLVFCEVISRPLLVLFLFCHCFICPSINVFKHYLLPIKKKTFAMYNL